MWSTLARERCMAEVAKVDNAEEASSCFGSLFSLFLRDLDVSALVRVRKKLCSVGCSLGHRDRLS